MPVVYQSRRNDHQRTAQLATAGQLPQDQRRLDSLSQADLVGDQEAPGTGRRDAVSQYDLMRQQIDPRRGQRSRVVHQWKRMRFNVQPGIAQAFLRSRDVADYRLFPALCRAQGVQENPTLTGREEDLCAIIGEYGDHHALAELGVDHPLPGVESALCH